MSKNFDEKIKKQIESVSNPDHQKALTKFVRYCQDSGKSKIDGKTQSMETISSKIGAIIPAIQFIGDKPLIEYTRDDMEDYIDSDEFRMSRLKRNGKRYEVKQSSLNLYKIHIRTFFKWVHHYKDPQLMRKTIYPDVVDWFEIKTIRKVTRPDELFTEEEVYAMINSRDLPRDQLLIALYYDTAGRLSEILDATEDKIIADKYGFLIVVEGKTVVRKIRLHVSVPYLKAYMQTPVRGRPLIRTVHGRMSDSRAEKIVKEAAKDAGIERNVYPHLFRHTTATRLASDLTDAELRAFGGWSKNSTVVSDYVHMSGAQIDKKMRQVYGLAVEDEEETVSILQPATCPRCQEVNAATTAFCIKCGMNLKEEAPLMKSEFDIMNEKLTKLETLMAMQKRMNQSINMRHESDRLDREYVPPEFPDAKYPTFPKKFEIPGAPTKEELQRDLALYTSHKAQFPDPDVDNLIKQTLKQLSEVTV